MGHWCQHAIVVTSYGVHVVRAHRKATELFGFLVSPVVDSKRNGYKSFFVAPDGSKEGWDASNQMDVARGDFMEWAQKKPQLKAVEVSFADNEGSQAHVVRSRG